MGALSSFLKNTKPECAPATPATFATFQRWQRQESQESQLSQVAPAKIEIAKRQKVATVAGSRRETAILREAADAASESDPVELEERIGMGQGNVPAVYLDAWTRLLLQRPAQVTDAAWREAVDAGGRFLDAWGGLAAAFDWTAEDLFDLPRDDGGAGLIWWTAGETVRSLGVDCAVTKTGRIFDRIRRGDWLFSGTGSGDGR